MVKEVEKPISENVSDKSGKLKLVLFNDDVNTFDDVIESLVDVCQHDPMQAENCALIAHYKGKCHVKSGSRKYLKPMLSGLSERNLTVEIQ